MQHARVPARPVAVGPTGNVLTVAFDTLANLLLFAVASMFVFAVAGDWIVSNLTSAVDPTGSASSMAVHVRLALVMLVVVGAVGAVYFGAGWRRFRSSLGLRMMRVFGVLPDQPRFPAVPNVRAYVWRFAVPVVLVAWTVVAFAVWFA